MHDFSPTFTAANIHLVRIIQTHHESTKNTKKIERYAL